MINHAVFLLGVFVASALGGPSDPTPNDTWTRRHQGFVNNTQANPGIPILFYGDSITYNWGGIGRPVFDQEYAPLGVANYGIGGDQVQHVHWRVINGEVEGLSPRLVVLMIGTNNLSSANNTEIARGISTLLAVFQELIPTAKILLLGILPRNGLTNFNRITDINSELAGLHNGRNIFFFNMFGSFAEEWGTVPISLFHDGLHLTVEGYRKWADTMRPIFDQLRQ